MPILVCRTVRRNMSGYDTTDHHRISRCIAWGMLCAHVDDREGEANLYHRPRAVSKHEEEPARDHIPFLCAKTVF